MLYCSRNILPPVNGDHRTLEMSFGEVELVGEGLRVIWPDEGHVSNFSGSLGMLPSATLPGAARSGQPIKGGIYEPTHGSAPDISGQGIANPIGTILSVAMMFEYGFGNRTAAKAIETAVERSLKAGVLLPDLGGTAKTNDMTQAVLDHL